VGLPSVALRYTLDALNVFRKLEEKHPDVHLTAGGTSDESMLQRVAYLEGGVSAAYLHSGNPNEAIRYAGEQLRALTRVNNADATTRAVLTDHKAAAHSHMGDALLLLHLDKERKTVRTGRRRHRDNVSHQAARQPACSEAQTSRPDPGSHRFGKLRPPSAAPTALFLSS
jgi:hypothetical protein